jgi:hypothetical protein
MRRGKSYHAPLKSVLFDSKIFLNTNRWIKEPIQNGSNAINPNFEWCVTIAAAMNCVRYDINREPSFPRWYVTRDSEMQNELLGFTNQTKDFYVNLERELTKIRLVSLMHRKVGYDGLLASSGGAKKSIVQRIKDSDLEFVKIICGKLSTENELYIDGKLNRYYATLDEHNAQHVRYGITIVTNKMFRQLKVGCEMKVNMILAFMSLFKMRDEKIFESHKAVNERNANYIPFLKSIFVGPQILQELVAFPDCDDEFIVDDITDVHRIYIAYNERNNEINGINKWTLIVVNLISQSIYYFDPTLDNSLNNNGVRSVPIDEATVVKMNNIKSCVNIYLRKKLQNVAIDFDLMLLPNNFHHHQQNDFDSGVSVVTSIYFLLHECPIVLKESQMNKLRVNLAYWISTSAFPV